ncbi:cobalamin biosynthesis protein [soil metagenome]
MAAGVVIDRLVGEPPADTHPVAAFGRAMGALEDRRWANSRVAGAAHVAIGVGLGAVAGLALRSTAAATYLAVAGRALDDAAAEVERALLDGDLNRARERLPALVGRDPSGLDAHEVARAAIESLAENSVDAVVAPAVWAVVAGAPGALGYRALNTLDAMVGHRTERHQRFGWASARLDDAANWVPARIAAALVAVVRPGSATTVVSVVRRDAPGHPSPNGGVIEAAFAAALGLRLGGPSRYPGGHEVRPTLGSGRRPTPADIADARRLARDLHLALAVTLALGAVARRSTRREVRR